MNVSLKVLLPGLNSVALHRPKSRRTTLWRENKKALVAGCKTPFAKENKK